MFACGHKACVRERVGFVEFVRVCVREHPYECKAHMRCAGVRRARAYTVCTSYLGYAEGTDDRPTAVVTWLHPVINGICVQPVFGEVLRLPDEISADIVRPQIRKSHCAVCRDRQEIQSVRPSVRKGAIQAGYHRHGVEVQESDLELAARVPARSEINIRTQGIVTSRRDGRDRGGQDEARKALHGARTARHLGLGRG